MKLFGRVGKRSVGRCLEAKRTHVRNFVQPTNTTVAFMATIEDDMDYLRDAGEDAVLDAVFNPPRARHIDDQPDLILLDASRGSIDDGDDAEVVP